MSITIANMQGVRVMRCKAKLNDGKSCFGKMFESNRYTVSRLVYRVTYCCPECGNKVTQEEDYATFSPFFSLPSKPEKRVGPKIEYRVGTLDRHGEIIDYPWYHEGIGSKARAIKNAKMCLGWDDSQAVIVERLEDGDCCPPEPVFWTGDADIIEKWNTGSQEVAE